MGRWFQEEVAGDRYIFDREKNPVVLGCPQGEPVFVIVGEQERAAKRACDAHNAMVSERDSYRHRAMEAEHSVSSLRAELARVKAESLRVVYLPDDYEFMGDYYMTPTGIGWNGSDRHGDSCVETPEGYHRFDECRKVKLERWEDE